MLSTELTTAAQALIHDARRILVTTHVKPDGDAIGSLVAMHALLSQQGKEVQPVLLSSPPPWYRHLLPDSVPILSEPEHVEALANGQWGTFDLVILLDVNSRNQLPRIETYLDRVDIPVLVVDHHATADHLGSLELIDDAAAATGLLIYEWARTAGWSLTQRSLRPSLWRAPPIPAGFSLATQTAGPFVPGPI